MATNYGRITNSHCDEYVFLYLLIFGHIYYYLYGTFSIPFIFFFLFCPPSYPLSFFPNFYFCYYSAFCNLLLS